MTLETSDIDKIAKLAKLQLDDSLRDDVTSKLNDFMGMIDQLQAIDAKDIPPMSHPLDETQRLREDVVTETDQREKLQAVAPSTAEGHYLVPQVID